MRNLLTALFLSIFCFSIICAQEITGTNTDVLYQRALEHYKKGDFKESLQLTQRALELAPEYHDIRILQIRNLWATENFSAADDDLDFLLTEAPEYPDVLPLVHKRITLFGENVTAFDFLSKVEVIYPADKGLQVKKAQLFLAKGARKEAREIAMGLISSEGITGAQRYDLQIILNRSVSDEVGISYQLVNFSKDYSRNDPWHTLSVEYQHNFNKTAVIGRVNYSDRGFDDAALYELEAYPVFNDRFYAFTNIGFSNGTIFPELRSSLSLFYNFAKVFEAEAGGRLLVFNESSYFTGILGLTLYSGKFYLNARSFLGPERGNQLVQNYQGNIRYYFSNADNYTFLRIGSGISPDERTLFSQVQENPALNAYYITAGFNFTAGVHHIFQVGAGSLYEDITNEKSGTQFLGNVSYRYRF